MSTRQGVRWSRNPKTGLPTIRRHPDAREYQTPEEVKRMVAGQSDEEEPYLTPEEVRRLHSGQANEVEPCPNCGGPADVCEDDE